jgi:hypothetical protein
VTEIGKRTLKINIRRVYATVATLGQQVDNAMARVQYKDSTRLIETGKATLAERSYNPK